MAIEKARTCGEWAFSFSETDQLPSIFTEALRRRIHISDVKINRNDDEGWTLISYYNKILFKVVSRNEIQEDDSICHALACYGVRKRFLGFWYDETDSLPREVLAAVGDVLRHDLKVRNLEVMPGLLL